MSTVTYATPAAVDPRDIARTARRSAAIAAPLMSVGAALIVSALTFMDPAKAGSVPRAMAGGPTWATADHVLVALGLAAITGAAVLALTALRDREARLSLGRHALADGGYALAVFVLAPCVLMSWGHYPLAADAWARPSATLVLVTGGMAALGAGLVGSARSGLAHGTPQH